MDQEFCCKWAGTVLKDVSDTFHCNESTGEREDLLLFQDQLDAQMQQEYKDICKEKASAYAHYYPANHTDEVAPCDAAPGAMVKHYTGVYLEEWLWEEGNIELWESDKFPAWRRCILAMHLVSKAWMKVQENEEAMRHAFTKTGCGITANGEDDELICPQKFKPGEYTLDYSLDAPAQV